MRSVPVSSAPVDMEGDDFPHGHPLHLEIVYHADFVTEELREPYGRVVARLSRASQVPKRMHGQLRVVLYRSYPTLFAGDGEFLMVERPFDREFERLFRYGRVFALHFPALFFLLLLIPTLLSFGELVSSVVPDEIAVFGYGLEVVLRFGLYRESGFEGILRL